ncbi:MAG: hypothetical protein WEB90_06235 [Gemmatimonadota bacterium]
MTVLSALALVVTSWSSAQTAEPCPSGPDSDLDGLSDLCEIELAAAYAPVLVTSPSACNWDASSGRLVGGYLFGAEPVGDRIRLLYLPAYLMDCGWSGPKCLLSWGGGCDPHAADSEVIAIDLAPGADGAWSAERVFLSAHCFDDRACRWYDALELDWLEGAPYVWVAEGKNANYPSRAACDSGHWHFDTCDRNDRSYRFPVESERQNIGSALRPFPAHTDDPACVAAGEIPHLADAPGTDSRAVECLWTDVAFRGWAGPEAAGVTGYARYFAELADLASPER